MDEEIKPVEPTAPTLVDDLTAMDAKLKEQGSSLVQALRDLMRSRGLDG